MTLTTDSERSLEAHSPIHLDQAAGVLQVTAGEVDLFVVPIGPDGQPGRRFHVATGRPGTLLIGSADVRRGEERWAIIGVGCQARATPLPRGLRDQLVGSQQLQLGLHQLLGEITAKLEVRGTQLAAEHCAGAAGAQPVAVSAGTVVNSRTDLRWLASADPVLQFAGAQVPAGMVVPLSARPVVAVTADTTATFLTTDMVTHEQLRESLLWTQQVILNRLVTLAEEHESQAAARLADHEYREQLALEGALGDLAAVEAQEQWSIDASSDEVLAACQALGHIVGVNIVAPPDWSAGQASDPVRAIARASGVRVRSISLTEDWQRFGIDPILAFDQARGAPVVLAPRRRGGYDTVDPATGTRTRLGGHQAESLRPSGYVLIPPLPAGGDSVRGLLGFGIAGDGKRDLLWMLGLSVITGMLSLVIPVFTGIILGSLLPQGRVSLVVASSLGLFLAVFATTGFLLSRAARLLRLQGRMLARMQSGIWDRLIALPVQFFTRYSVGDLTQRAGGIEAIQMIVSSVGSQTLLAFVTLLFSLGLLFVYSTTLGLLVLVVTVVVVLVSATITWQQIKALRRMYDAKGEASAVLLQLVLGIDKVRAAAAENRALGAWAAQFAGQARSLLVSESLSAIRTAIYAALPVALTFLVFAVVGADPSSMSTAAFLGFVTALGQVTAATTQLDLSLGYSLNILPLFDRMRPLLTEPREIAVGAADPGRLSGRVALNNLTYRYPGMSSPVLSELNLEIRPGEFVAIVGPSGSGKSTVVRMLLGFDRPETGSVTYDDKDLAELDPRAVRAQIGVALQDAPVTGGNILSAIVGDWPLTEADAWAAAEKVGLADDIRALPMGIRTILGDNAATFSGGQRQRLVLAAAIARNPRLVILDEATSALDSVTQAQVASSFERLQVTRVVVAHRLSTIRGADRIVVLDGGRIVQTGNFETLSGVPGVFQEMIRRQLA